MECPMCWELYNLERIARNLLCGHTYCQICLDQIVIHKRRIECPMCRHKHDPQLKVTSLSRNYVAMELAHKHLEVTKKLQMCTTHNKNPLQFFCEDCQLHLCTDCIVEHSGHKFCKQEHSIYLLSDRLHKMQEKLKVQLDQQEKQTSDFGSNKAKLTEEHNQQLKGIDLEFDKLIQKVEERRLQLKQQYKQVYDEETKVVENDLVTNLSLLDNMKKINQKMESSISELQVLKVLKNDQMIKQVDDLEEEADKDIKQQCQLKVNEYRQMPKLTFDLSIYNELSKFGQLALNYQHPKLCFFGDKHKILLYDIEKEEWSYKQMPQPCAIEFNYYSASCSLPSGEIMMTGGGISKATVLISPSKNFSCTPLKNMFFPRKEHATVYLNGCVYAIGGYDGSQKQMLSSCERYSLEQNEWRVIEPLQKAKCAFAASAVNSEYIYVFGGFDGRERLNTIERYHAKENKWSVIETKFKNGFSNAASVSYTDNKILILGGGSNQGFTLDLQLFDLVNNTLKTLNKMSEGRDLRNKLTYMNGYLYSCGGGNCSAEKYCIQTNKWIQLKNFNNFVSDNLDSWCCALTFDAPEGKNQSSLMQQITNKANNYQIYEYFSDGQSEELVDEEEDQDYDHDHDQYEDLEDLNFGIGNLNPNSRGRVFQI